MHQPKFISIVWSLVSLFIGKKIRSRYVAGAGSCPITPLAVSTADICNCESQLSWLWWLFARTVCAKMLQLQRLGLVFSESLSPWRHAVVATVDSMQPQLLFVFAGSVSWVATSQPYMSS